MYTNSKHIDLNINVKVNIHIVTLSWKTVPCCDLKKPIQKTILKNQYSEGPNHILARKFRRWQIFSFIYNKVAANCKHSLITEDEIYVNYLKL